MKNKLGDLNNHLFAELERLSDEDLKGDDLKNEIDRAKGVQAISNQILQGYSLKLDALKFATEYGQGNTVVSAGLIEKGDDNEKL